MKEIPISIILRGSDDFRIFKLIDSIDVRCDLVGAITPNAEIERGLKERGIRYALSEKGNLALTKAAALPFCRWKKILIVDSDCVFKPGAIERMYELSLNADIVCPNILFEALDLSSRCTAIARTFQYTYCGFIYEPGLLINLETALPRVGGYLSTPYAMWASDGEFDYRASRAGLKIARDPETTLVHAAFPFWKHLRAYWHYGIGDMNCQKNLNQPVFRVRLAGIPLRYRSALSRRYPLWTTPIMVLCDLIYYVSMIRWWLIAKKGITFVT